jgi:ubiquinone/menaquinone biosynthesis C-methylase UbiE
MNLTRKIEIQPNQIDSKLMHSTEHRVKRKNYMSFIKAYLKSNRVLNFNLRERDIWVEKQASSIPENHYVLDVGAGSCPYRSYFIHCNYQTQDFSGLSPEQLRGRSGYDYMDYICDATSIPVPGGIFDAVLCTEVLEHVSEPIKVVYEFARILKPGGKLILSAPLGSGIHQHPYHFYGGYTPYWYQKFLTEAGFSDVEVKANGGFFKHFGQESIRFVRMTIPWKLSNNIILCSFWSPLWLIFLPWFAVIVPIFCHFLDRFDQVKDFTVGDHVTAIKKGT